MKTFQKSAVASLGLSALPALAVSPFDSLTTAVSFTDVSAAVLVAAVAVVGLVLIIKGITLVIRMVRRA